MKLHGSTTSPYVRHCRIALMQQQRPFDFIETDYAASARQSPTQRVPFLVDDDLVLTDSSSILKHIRETGGREFCASPREFDFYLMATTALDATVNLFLLERDGVTVEQAPYLGRQRDRISTSLDDLERQLRVHPERARPDRSDALLRLGCFLSWAEFRKRLDVRNREPFKVLLERLGGLAPFEDTAPGREA